LVDIETDKVVLEVPAPRAGTVIQLHQPVGTAVVSGDLLASLDDGAEVLPEIPHAFTPPETQIPLLTSEPPLVMPAAEKLLREQGISPVSLSGSGRGGRILKEDVSVNPVVTEKKPPLSRVPMSPVRRRVAQRLMESQSQTATLTTFNEVDMSAVLALRQRHKEAFEKRFGVRLGLMSFFVKAICAALEHYPVLNEYIEGTDVVTPDGIHIGVAVGSRRGLLVPVLRHAQRLTMAQIEQHIHDFFQRADTGHIEPQELEGGTFSVSNGGVFGSMLSTPILNPPQSAILGIHATQDRPVVVDGEIVVRPMNYLALSYDHRLIDGREAVLALVAIKQGLEDPARWLLGV
jgi:2-oxoglutarate dehydrogenase E2 component (dihydrolipoamide succinyltransferase)